MKTFSVASLLPVVWLAVAFNPAVAEWEGEGEFGLVVARGNSETETVNLGVEAAYTRGLWRNQSNFSFLRSEDSDELTANRFVIANKTDYELSERSYLVGAGRYDRDRFSSFRFQGTYSSGYGYRPIKTERHEFNLEGGLGFRYAEIRDTGETESDIILRAFAEYLWKISETSRLTNRTLVESGDDNTFSENATELTVAINSRLSLRTAFSVRRNSNVEPGRDKTDTLTRLNLVYNF